MTFSEIVSKYIDELGITAKELSDYCGISTSTISRYRAGSRTPIKDSKQYMSLIRGFGIAIEKKNRTDISEEKIKKEIEGSFSEGLSDFNPVIFRYNFISLMSSLNISLKEIADGVGYDVSYISRLRTGKRSPADPVAFIDSVSRFVAENYNDPESKKSLAVILNCWEDELDSKEKIESKVYHWLLEDANSRRTFVEEMIERMDAFNDAEYHRKRIGDIVKNIEKNSSEEDFTYEVKNGIQHLKECEYRFISRVLKSENKKGLRMCWDIPGDIDKGLDIEMMGFLTVLVDRGVEISIVHPDDGPMSETISWLIKWLPIFMTGKVKPYYMERSGRRVFSNSILAADHEVMYVDAVEGHFDSARITLSSEKDDVSYYKEKAEKVIDISHQLIDIINENEKERREEFLSKYVEVEGKRKNLLATPPVYTISEELLDRIFDENDVAKDDRELIKDYIWSEKERVKKILKHSEQEDHIPELSREDFEKGPMYLSLSGLFYDKYIYYSYEDYLEHMRLTKELEKKHNNYSLILRQDMRFRNVQLFMQKDKWVIISKNVTPAIHFIVSYPEVRESLEAMIEMY
ncbi:MAG: helix-turn-helix domain-containing protein [Eubacterium sp.]|nr:helix-turn-helix domain-containing protein [Eubacterium sp.]